MYKSYGSNGTIREVLDAIQRRALVLPAIQREFVWRPEQICNFFDSLMQGYPFGTFLFWSVEPTNSNNFKWYDFVRNYHEKDHPHCPELGELPNQALTAVLDGQQRLTALNIGLQGSMAWKLPRAHYRFPQNFPTRSLYLNILARAGEEPGARYQRDCRGSKTSTRHALNAWKDAFETYWVWIGTRDIAQTAHPVFTTLLFSSNVRSHFRSAGTRWSRSASHFTGP